MPNLNNEKLIKLKLTDYLDKAFNGLTEKSIAKGRNIRQQNALCNERNKQASSLILSMRNGGSKWSEIVKQLNANGFRTRRECSFNITSVKRLYQRYNEKSLRFIA